MTAASCTSQRCVWWCAIALECYPSPLFCHSSLELGHIRARQHVRHCCRCCLLSCQAFAPWGIVHVTDSKVDHFGKPARVQAEIIVGAKCSGLLRNVAVWTTFNKKKHVNSYCSVGLGHLRALQEVGKTKRSLSINYLWSIEEKALEGVADSHFRSDCRRLPSYATVGLVSLCACHVSATDTSESMVGTH